MLSQSTDLERRGRSQSPQEYLYNDYNDGKIIYILYNGFKTFIG
jgi:hypothetical protein